MLRSESERMASLPGERWLEITTRLGCRVACTYCPQSRFVAAFRRSSRETELTLETFGSCLESVPKDVLIVFAGYTEPWLNPSCTDMVELASTRGYATRAYTTCAGMTTADVARLSELSLDGLYVHLPTATPGRMRLLMDTAYLVVLDSIAARFGRLATYLYHGDAERQHPLVEECLARHGLEAVAWKIHSRAGHLEDVPRAAALEGAIRCAQGRERKNVLLPDGSVALCCMDWGLDHVLGNLIEGTYERLFSSQAYRDLLSGMADGEGARLCRGCEWAESAARTP